MKRREMIRAAGAAVLSPFVFRSTPDFSLAEQTGNVFLSSQVNRFGDGRDWFFRNRFGMFVHWGIYSIPGWHEQHQWRARVPRSSYILLAKRWNPVKFNPERWLDLLQAAGMSYLTVTAKHHDGFCLWDTKQTSFNTMNTPYGKDIIRMIADACHRRNIPLCIYYSIADWNHPSYPNMGRHHELPGPEPGDRPDWAAYMEFVKMQVRELCTNYGEIHGFWWDMNVPKHQDRSVNEMIRKLQPKAVINNRGFDEGDFGTPERDYDREAMDAASFTRPTEACQSVGMESWGFKKDEDYYTVLHLTRSIDSYLARDANYLLNVGPDSMGLIPSEAVSILKRTGKWYLSVKESYEDVQPAPLKLADSRIMTTARGKTLYLHLNKELPGNAVRLKPVNIKPLRATLLNINKELECVVNLSPSDHAEQKPYLRIRNLPLEQLVNSVPVIRLEFDRPLKEIL